MTERRPSRPRGLLDGTAMLAVLDRVGRGSSSAVACGRCGSSGCSGDPWRPSKGVLGDRRSRGATTTSRPSTCSRRMTRNLPHLWTIVGASRAAVLEERRPVARRLSPPGRPSRRLPRPPSGSCWAPLIGIVLASVFVHSRLAERALLPWVIASQTLPIVALAPILVIAFGQGLVSVVIVATYLTFFPVTIADGCAACGRPIPRLLELMRSYAASTLGRSTGRCGCRHRCRTCSSALKVAATASIVGAIIGEGPGGVQGGLGRAIIMLQPAVHLRARAAVGDHPRVGAPGHLLLLLRAVPRDGGDPGPLAGAGVMKERMA